MHRDNIEFLDELPPEVEQKVTQGHEEHETFHGVVCDYQTFSIVAHNDDGEPIGVLNAYSAYAELYVDDIWVDARHRKQGYGTRLLHALEERYEGKGYNNINLVTNGFQAAGFYEKCGYEIEFSRPNAHHPKLTKTFFVKYFNGTPQTKGVL